MTLCDECGTPLVGHIEVLECPASQERPQPPDAALRVEYNTGRTHGYEEGLRAGLAQERPPLDVERLASLLAQRMPLRYDPLYRDHDEGYINAKMDAEWIVARLSAQPRDPTVWTNVTNQTLPRDGESE